MGLRVPAQEAANDEISQAEGETVNLGVEEGFYGAAANESRFAAPTPEVEPSETVSVSDSENSGETSGSDSDFGVVGETPDIPSSPSEEGSWSDEIVGEMPAYPDQFAKENDVSRPSEQGGQIEGKANENVPNVLEREIRDMEHAVKVGEINASIASIRSQIEQVNRAVQLNRISTAEGDKRHEDLRTELARLEDIKRGPTPSEQANFAADKTEAAAPVTAEKTETNPEKAEYLRLKREFKDSERAYLETLKQDYSKRGIEDKIMGLGRGSMSPDLQVAYDKFMTANKTYYQFAENSGAYKQIAERLNKNRSPEEQTTLHAAVAGRHVLRPAEERLKIQTLQMPKWMADSKNKISEIIKAHPKVAMAVGGAVLIKSAVFSMPALLAGMGTRMIGGKIGDSLDSNRLDKKFSIMAKMGTEVDLEELESQYFAKLNLVQKVRTGTKWASIGAGIAAGGISASAYGGEGVEVVPPSGTEVLPGGAEVEAVEKIVGAELPVQAEPVLVETFTPRPGQNLSTALLDTLRQRVEAGSLHLPPGITEKNLSEYMYKVFPEMTEATGLNPRLTPDEWVKLGVLSGDPNNIQVGEPINLQSLIDKIADTTDSGAKLKLSGDNIPGAVPDISAQQVSQPLYNGEPNQPDAREPQFDRPSIHEKTQLHVREIAAGEYNQFDAKLGIGSDTHTTGTNEYSGNDLEQRGVEGHAHNYGGNGKPAEIQPPAPVEESRLVRNETHPIGSHISQQTLDGKGANSSFTFDSDGQSYVRGEYKYQSVPHEVGPAADHALPPYPDQAPAPEVKGSFQNTPEQVSSRELLAERYGRSPQAAIILENLDGYHPLFTPQLLERSLVIEPGTTAKDFANILYRQTTEAFIHAEINLPAQTTEYVIHNPTAINAFVDKNASEFATEFNPLLSGKQPLDLSVDQWKELGFRSGNPRELVQGDKVEMGKLIKLILENAAERANARQH